MKSLIIGLVATGMIFSSVQAQNLTVSKSVRLGFGVFAGQNCSTPLVSIQYAQPFNAHTDWLAGVDVNYQLTDRLSLHVQPAWTRIRNARPNGYVASPIFSVSTLKIPFSYRYYVLPNQRTLFVEAGVGYNQIVKSSYYEEIPIECFVAPCPRFYTSNLPALSKVAVSGLAGVGFNIELQKINIPVTLRYERYVSNYTFPGLFDGQPTSVKFESFALTTGINF